MELLYHPPLYPLTLSWCAALIEPVKPEAASPSEATYGVSRARDGASDCRRAEAVYRSFQQSENLSSSSRAQSRLLHRWLYVTLWRICHAWGDGSNDRDTYRRQAVRQEIRTPFVDGVKICPPRTSHSPVLYTTKSITALCLFIKHLPFGFLISISISLDARISQSASRFQLALDFPKQRALDQLKIDIQVAAAKLVGSVQVLRLHRRNVGDQRAQRTRVLCDCEVSARTRREG